MNAPKNPPFLRSACGLVFAVALVASPRVASAACHSQPGESLEPGSPAYERLQDCRWRNRVGLELTARVGMGMAVDPASPTFVLGGDASGQRMGPGFGLDMALGWRIIPAISIGGHLYYQYSPAYGLREGIVTRSNNDFTVTGGHTDVVSAGIYGRFYIGAAAGLRRVEPWIGIGFDFPSNVWVATYVHALVRTTDMAGNTTTSEQDGTLTLTVASVGLPISVGVDYNVTPEFSLGIGGHLSLLFPYGRCGNTSILSATTGAQQACNWMSYDVTPTFFVGAEGRFLAPW